MSYQPVASSSKLQQPQKNVVSLSVDLMQRIKPAKVFKDAIDRSFRPTNPSYDPVHAPSQITSIAFTDNGERCVTAGEDEQFVLWDAKKGKKINTFQSRKYGVGHVRMTHSNSTLVYASTKTDHAIRYHSLHDNKYLNYFHGHTGRVRSLHMHPSEDKCISAGDDGTVRLWDLKSNACAGLINDVGGSTIAAYDSSGTVFGVACSETQTIYLFGTEGPDSGPFFTGPLIDVGLAEISQPPPKPIFTSISFSNNGKYILVGTSSDVHYLLDAFSLLIIRRLVGHQGLERNRDGSKGVEPRRGGSGEEVSWTSDSRWVISGSADGSVCMWDMTPPQGMEKLEVDPSVAALADKTTTQEAYYKLARSMQPTVRLPAKGMGSSRAVVMNPRYLMMGVGGDDLSFWLSAKDEDQKIEEGY